MEDASNRNGASAAAPTGSAAGLDACFGAMRLVEDPQPSLHHRSQPNPEPLRAPVPPPATRAVDAMQQLKQYWPQAARPPSYDVAESSAAAEYASVAGSRNRSSSFSAPYFGPYSPHINDLAAEFPSVSAFMGASAHPLVSPSPSMPSCSTSHSVPQLPSAFAVHDDGFQHQPLPDYYGQHLFPQPVHQHHQPELHQPHQPVRQLLSAPYHHRSLVAQQNDNNAAGGINPYAYAAYPSNNLHANNNNRVVDYQQPWTGGGMPSVRRAGMKLQEGRARLLRGLMDPALVMSAPGIAAHVARLLRQGAEDQVRWSVLAGVVSAVHSVMESREGRVVFVALLDACGMRFEELRGIVHAVCGGKDVLMDILQHDHGVKSLKDLITAVASYDELSQLLILWLLRERLMEHCKCGNIVNHCFAIIPYETCSIMISFAIDYFEVMLSSTSGSIYMVECFANARDDELRCLEKIVLRKTTEIAMGQYSNYFLQRVLGCGSDDLKERIAKTVAKRVATLSVDKFGSYVVESCIRLTCSRKPLRCVLVAVLNLPGEQLGELVQGSYSNYVVHKLLAAGKRPFPAETAALARRIEKLPAAVQRDMHAQGVMRVIEKQFPRFRRPRN